MEEKNELMLKACFQPEVSPMAQAVFSAINSYAGEASKIIGGMRLSFNGLDRDYLLRMAKRFRNIDLTRYEPYINMYANGLSKLYEKGNKQDG